MATKWNLITEKGKGFTAIVAWVLGLTMLLGGGLGFGNVALRADPAIEWWRGSWQDTPAFRETVSGYLRGFLELGAGKSADWYSKLYFKEEEGIFPREAFLDWMWMSPLYTVSESPAAELAVESDSPERRPDHQYYYDDNVLYAILGDGAHIYSNASTTSAFWMAKPKGYNFFLTYEEGTVTLEHSGAKVDVYGDGNYQNTSQWYVPGYENFQAPKDFQPLRIRVAIRETPMEQIGRGSSEVYDMYREWTDTRFQAFGYVVTALVGLGMLLLSLPWREQRKAAGRSVARCTRHIPSELWWLTLLALLTLHIFLVGAVYLVAETAVQVMAGRYGALLGLILPLYPTAALGLLLWLVLLWRNHRRWNRERRSIFAALRARDLQRPIQKRLRRLLVLGALVGLGALVMVTFLGMAFLANTYYYHYALPVWAILGVLFLMAEGVVAWFLLALWRSRRLPEDFGALTDQMTAIHSGDFSKSLTLPQDADLCQAAQQLSTIQSGLEQALLEQMKSERMKVELISNVSHDLKTPLTSVLSYAQLLQEEPLEGAARDYASIILDKAKRLETMVQDVFAVSKAASGALPMKEEGLDMVKLLRQTLADMADAVAQSGLEVKLHVPEGEVPLLSDGTLLYRVFQNLLQNALQYSLPSSRVHLTLRREGERAVVTVQNVSKNELPRGVDFTERFFSGDESRHSGGSGLGLSIAKTFTERCGGTFAVETQAELFTAIVTLPAKA